MPSVDLNGKVAIVTGAAGGIGQVLAEKLLERGAKVCVCDIKEAECQKVGARLEAKFGKGRVLPLYCDITSDDSVRDLLSTVKSKLGNLDIMVNNAAWNNEENFRSTFEINLFGVIRGTDMALEEMRKPKGKGGVIINVGSIVGMLPSPLQPRYATTKAAVIHYTRNIGHPFHYADTGVRVVALCPGKTLTPLLDSLGDGNYNERCKDMLQKVVPPMPTLMPETVAKGLLRLIDDGKTSAVLLVESGLECGKYMEPVSDIPDYMLEEMNILQTKQPHIF